MLTKIGYEVNRPYTVRHSNIDETLVHKGNCDGSDTSEQRFLGGITRDQAFDLLRSDVAIAEQAVNTYVTVPLTQAQFDALVSFTYNLGSGNFKNSDLLKKLNAGQYDAVPGELNKWVYGGGKVLPGLVTRRSDEGTLFQSEGLASGASKQVALTLYIHDGSAIGPVIPSAEVRGQDGSGNIFQWTTDSNGYVTITGDPGDWSFSVSADGYETNSWDQEITKTDTKYPFLQKVETRQESVAFGTTDASTTMPESGNSIVGRWLIDRGDAYKYTTFHNDGTLIRTEWVTTPPRNEEEWGDGTWTQNGNSVSWEEDAFFEGTINGNTMHMLRSKFHIFGIDSIRIF